MNSYLEFYANIGMNLKALKLLLPGLDAHGIEINADAAHQLSEAIPARAGLQHAHSRFQPKRSWDLALIKGVLIHINPQVLPQVFDKLVASTSRYLLVAYYYNLVPVAIAYRGHTDRLFKRDFAGEIMDRPTLFKIQSYP